MDKTLNNSLYEQLLYIALRQVMDAPGVEPEDRLMKAKELGEVFGRKALLVYSKHLPHTAFSSTEKIIYLVANELWPFIFGNPTSDVTSPNNMSISFKDNNLALLKRLDAPPEQKDQREQLLTVSKAFFVGIITGILSFFKIECEVRIIYQNESLFVHVTCDPIN